MGIQYSSVKFNRDLTLRYCCNIEPPSEEEFLADNDARLVCDKTYLYIRNDNDSFFYEVVLPVELSSSAVSLARDFINNYFSYFGKEVNYRSKCNCSNRQSDFDCFKEAYGGCCVGTEEENSDEDTLFPSIKCDQCDVDAEEIYLSRDILTSVTDDIKLNHLVVNYLVNNLLRTIRVLKSLSPVDDIYTVTTEFKPSDIELFYGFISELGDIHQEVSYSDCCCRGK